MYLALISYGERGLRCMSMKIYWLCCSSLDLLEVRYYNEGAMYNTQTGCLMGCALNQLADLIIASRGGDMQLIPSWILQSRSKNLSQPTLHQSPYFSGDLNE
jgi:hypothetical protein